jgi:hypothetical protein
VAVKSVDNAEDLRAKQKTRIRSGLKTANASLATPQSGKEEEVTAETSLKGRLLKGR